MKKLSSSLAARITPVTFLLTAVVTITLLLGSAQLGVAEEAEPAATIKPLPLPTPASTPVQVTVQVWSGSATISTASCASSSPSPGGLCQPSPACNGGAGPNPDTINATVTLCEVAAVPTVNGPSPMPTISPNPVGPIFDSISLTTGGWLGTKPPKQAGTLTGSGTGSGFRPNTTYISLIYQNPNTATCSRFPPGVPPTLQNLSKADSDFPSMFLGFWIVDSNGNGTLKVDKQATALGLNQYTTLSVRETQQPNVACYDCGNDPAPQFNALRACGTLNVVPSTTCSLPQLDP